MIATVGRRLALAFFTHTPPEALDAGGNYRSIIYRRPALDDSQALQDYQRVRSELIASGDIRTFPFEFILVGATVLIGFLAIVRAPFAGGWGTIALFVLPMTIACIGLGSRIYLRATRMEANEELIAAGWLRIGCCPHCAYRLPPRQPHEIVRCTECGTAWRTEPVA